MPYKKRNIILAVSLFLISIIVFISSLLFGSSEMTSEEIIGAILQKDGYETQSVIIRNIRLPRLFAGVLAGVGLSCSGLLLQTITGNPLCSPGVLGINAGAGLGVTLFMLFFPAMYQLFPFAAFVGAMISTVIIILLCVIKKSSRLRLVLSGVAVSSILSAGISLICMTDSDLLQSYTAFSVGGLGFVKTNELIVPCAIIITGLILCIITAPTLNILSVGHETAGSLGVKVKRLNIFALVLASALSASVVCFAGLLGFVGLIVPHIGRKLAGNNLKILFPVSSVIGANTVVFSDLLGRTLFSPTELPVGIIMAFVGGPFFLWLLLNKNKGGSEYD